MKYLAFLLLAFLPAARPVAVSGGPAGVVDSHLYHLTGDVRIKRMHLMRPDLISYPLLQDYYA